jgi:hypothetical protein
MASIADQIRNRIKIGYLNPVGFKAYAPALVATRASIAADEDTLGFLLPPLLKELYLEIGNGGWGPGYGLLGLSGGAADDTGRNAIEDYSARRAWSAPDAGWPERLIPICHWGCAICSCIDCSKPNFALIAFDPNIEVSGAPGMFCAECDTFEEWMRLWAGSHNLWDRLYGENGAMLKAIKEHTETSHRP